MAKKENKEVKKAIEVIDEMSMDPKEWEIYESREKAIMNYNSGMKSAERRGMEKRKKRRQRRRHKRRKETDSTKITTKRWKATKHNGNYRFNKGRNRRDKIIVNGCQWGRAFLNKYCNLRSLIV